MPAGNSPKVSVKPESVASAAGGMPFHGFFPSRSVVMRYQITYTTPITDGGSALTYTNDVTVTPPDEDGHDPQTAHGTGKVEEATAISKSLVSAGNDNQTLHWMTTFTAKRAVASATITDTLDVDGRGENHGPLQTLDAGPDCPAVCR